MRTRDVSFFVDGDLVVGTLYLPDGTKPVPGVVYCQGFGGTREYIAPDLGERFTEAGTALLAFDHRGFGDSEGRAHRIVPEEQVDDVRTATLFLTTCPEIDPDSIGLLGVSFGGAVAVAAAASEPAVRATVSCVPFADGTAWMREIRRYWEWVEFEERLAHDRLQALRTGESELVDPDEILVRDPESIEWNDWLKTNFPSRTGFTLSLASARAILGFRPVEVAHLVENLLVVTVDRDTLIPAEHAMSIFERAPEPKHVHVVHDATHHDIYRAPAFDELTRVVTSWFDRHFRGGPR